MVAERKKSKDDVDDISGGIYILYFLTFVIRFQFFTVSWMDSTKKVG